MKRFIHFLAFGAVVICLLIAFSGCGSEENARRGKSRNTNADNHEKTDRESSAVIGRWGNELSGTYTVSEFFRLSKKSPIVLFYVSSEAKDATVESIYVFENARVFVYPHELLYSCFGDDRIRILLKLVFQKNTRNIFVTYG
jgi:hypothetical protein